MKQKNNIEDFKIYINLLSSFNNNIKIKESKSYVEINYNNKIFKVTNLPDFNNILNEIITIEKPSNKQDLFIQCNNLTNFIINNSKYKVILDNILPNNQDFKNLFLFAIRIDNSENIFKDITEKQLEIVNLDNINTILSNFIVHSNNRELENIKTLEVTKVDLEKKLDKLQISITELTKEKLEKEKNMYEKNSVMVYYDEFKKVEAELNNINNQIKKYDNKKMKSKIQNIDYQKEIDNLSFEKNKLNKNFIIKFFNKKKILLKEEKIIDMLEKISKNTTEILDYKKKNQELKQKKEKITLDFCNTYNEGLKNLNETKYDFNSIKSQFKKIREFNEFKKQFELDGLVNRRNELKNKLIDINEKTKYKTKFYLIYQIKTVCDIMNIPIDDVLNKEYLEIVTTKSTIKK